MLATQSSAHRSNMATLKGFPARFKDTDPSECRGEGWLSHFIEARALLQEGGIAVFVGGCGTGKTRMSYELAKFTKPRSVGVWGMKKAMPCYYTTAARMLEDVRETFGGDYNTPSEKVATEVFTDASLLVIDELDNCMLSDFAQRKLKQVVDERYQAKLPTILITNHDRKKLKQLLPEPVMDRIREVGRGFHFYWPSFRGQ